MRCKILLALLTATIAFVRDSYKLLGDVASNPTA